MMADYELEGINYIFGKEHILDAVHKARLFDILSKLPSEAVNCIATHKYIFISTGRLHGCNETFENLKKFGNGIIWINPNEWDKPQSIAKTVAHEIAHLFLNHESGLEISEIEFNKLELEANELAERWLRADQ